jgi:hypothetical protein
MKFFLTIFICSGIDGACIIPAQEPYIYPKIFDSHYECVRAGLSESYEILYAEKFFDEKGITQYKLYPKFGCDETSVVGENT